MNYLVLFIFIFSFFWFLLILHFHLSYFDCLSLFLFFFPHPFLRQHIFYSFQYRFMIFVWYCMTSLGVIHNHLGLKVGWWLRLNTMKWYLILSWWFDVFLWFLITVWKRNLYYTVILKHWFNFNLIFSWIMFSSVKSVSQ